LRRLVLAQGAALALFSADALANDRACFGVDYADDQALVMGRIKPDVGKVHFRKEGESGNACPSPAPECQEKAYLAPGDLVVLGAKYGDYVCVDYAKAKGGRGGWLPASAIEPVAAATDPAAWAGKWKRVEAEIRIAQNGDGLKAEGDATWGALDPHRAGHGGVNVGDFSGTLNLKDGQATFRDEDGFCSLRMTRAGDFLFVRDNLKCGGFNVSFSGMYRRAKK
jgi:hypothetical protein